MPLCILFFDMVSLLYIIRFGTSIPLIFLGLFLTFVYLYNTIENPFGIILTAIIIALKFDFRGSISPLFLGCLLQRICGVLKPNALLDGML